MEDQRIKEPVTVKIDVGRFYDVVACIKQRDYHIDDRLETFIQETLTVTRKLEEEQGFLIRVNSAMLQEIRSSSRTNPFKPIGEQQQDHRDFMPMVEGTSFFRVALGVVGTFASELAADGAGSAVRGATDGLLERAHRSWGHPPRVRGQTGQVENSLAS